MILAEAGAGPVTYMSVKRLLVAELGAEVCARQSIVVKSTIHKHVSRPLNILTSACLFQSMVAARDCGCALKYWANFKICLRAFSFSKKHTKK